MRKILLGVFVGVSATMLLGMLIIPLIISAQIAN
jgi:hypothetical protein